MKKRKAKTLWKDFLGNVPFYEPRKDFLCALCVLCVEALERCRGLEASGGAC